MMAESEDLSRFPNAWIVSKLKKLIDETGVNQ